MGFEEDFRISSGDASCVFPCWNPPPARKMVASQFLNIGKTNHKHIPWNQIMTGNLSLTFVLSGIKTYCQVKPSQMPKKYRKKGYLHFHTDSLLKYRR